MHALFQAALSNAILASLMGLGLGCVAPWIRQPVLRHTLWLLVLAKLVTPPLWTIELGWFARGVEPRQISTPAIPSISRAGPQLDSRVDDLASSHPGTIPGLTMMEPRDKASARGSAGELSLAATGQATRGAPNPATWPARAWNDPRVLRTLLGIWLAGACIVVVLAGWRAARFGKFLRRARPAAHGLQLQANALAARLALPTVPRLVVVEAPLAPFLWPGRGGATVGLPACLIADLSAGELETLIAHELAHYRRHDHWTRWVVTLIMGLYWWHPVAWWARRQLHRAEEEACDAWVVWAFPTAAKSYAGAVLRTLELISPQASLPAPACGLGEPRRLRYVKERFHMILNHRFSHRLSPRQMAFAGSLAILLLPIAGVVLPAPAAESDAIDPPSQTRPASRDLSAVRERLDRLEGMVEQLADLIRSGSIATPQDVLLQQEKSRAQVAIASDRSKAHLEVALERARHQLEIAQSAGKTEIATHELEVEAADAELERAAGLSEQRLISESEVRKAQHRLRLAQLALAHAKVESDARIAEAELTLKALRAELEKVRTDGLSGPLSDPLDSPLYSASEQRHLLYPGGTPRSGRLSATDPGPGDLAGVVVTVRSTAPQFVLGDRPMSLEDLRRTFERISKEGSRTTIRIEANPEVPYGHVFDVFNAATEAGLTARLGRPASDYFPGPSGGADPRTNPDSPAN
jgi:beta-lactamase regulating signal transducer with metallopeptidase domain